MRYVRLLAVAVLAVLLALSATQNAFAAVIDQQQLTSGVGAMCILTAMPLGQSFVPSMPTLNGVDIIISDWNGGGGDTLTMIIHQGTISGSIIAGPVSTFLPNGFGNPGGAWKHFEWAGVAVTPGATYVIEVQATTTEFCLNFNGGNPYPAGSLIRLGNPQLPDDLAFKTWGSAAPVLDPTHGFPGTMVTVTGSGFTRYADSRCEIHSTPTGLVGTTRDTDFGCNILADGSVDGWFIVQGGASGSYLVTVYYAPPGEQPQESPTVGFNTDHTGGAPVGGFMEPVNKLTVLAPYLALFGVVAVVVVAVFPWKKRGN